MINETKALSLAEASEFLQEDSEIKSYVKRFTKMKSDEAVKMRKEIEDMDSIRIKSEHIVKIIDLLPEDAQDVSKIFSDVSLDENETNKILEIVKKYK